MADRKTFEAPPGRLPLKVQRVTDERGDTSELHLVMCPSRGTIDAEACAHCRDGHGRTIEGSRPYVLCSAAPPVVAHAAGWMTPVERVMTPIVRCVRKDVRLDAVAAIFDYDRIDAVPVVDELGLPIGVVSKTDVCRELARAPSHRKVIATHTVSEVMSRPVLSLAPDAPIASAAAVMSSEGMHHAVIVDERRRVIGMLSAHDLLAWLAREAGISA